MKKKFFAVAALIAGSPLFAQQDTTVKTMDEVVLTANKYPGKTSLTGKVVTVITRQQLEQSGGQDLSQILTSQAGLYINGANSNAGKDKSIYLRGARVDHTLITIDGIPVYDASGVGGNFDLRNLSIDQVERIEILKGSQSTLYGSDALAGVINIITKKTTTEKTTAQGIFNLGSYQAMRAHAGISGKKGVADYQAGYTFYDTKGINEAVNNNNPGPVDKDGYTQKNLQANLGIQVNPHFYTRIFFRHGNINGDIDQGAFTDELDFTFTQKSLQAGIRNELSYGKTKWNIIYQFNHINRLYEDDSTRSRNGFDTYSRGAYKGNEHFADIYMHRPAGKTIQLTAGADFRQSRSDQEYFSVGFFGPYSTRYSSDSLKQTQLGLYTALNLHLKNGFSMEAGNRINIHSGYGRHYVYNINPSYLINNKVKLFVNLSSGYRTPSLYQLYSEYGNDKLEPEAAVTMEGGLHFFAPGNNFTSRITFFRRDVRDVIFFFYNPVTYRSQYINQDRQKDHGAELEISFTPVKNISLKAYYTYVNGKISTLQNGKDTTYFNLLRRPKNSFGIHLGFQVTDRLFISSNLFSSGKREDAYFDTQTFRTVQVTLDSYVLWDVYAEMGFLKNRLRLFTDFRNITHTVFTEVVGFNTPDFNGSGGIRLSF